MQQAVELKAPAVAASALEQYEELGLTLTGVQVPVFATLLFASVTASENGSSFKFFRAVSFNLQRVGMPSSPPAPPRAAT